MNKFRLHTKYKIVFFALSLVTSKEKAWKNAVEEQYEPKIS